MNKKPTSYPAKHLRRAIIQMAEKSSHVAVALSCIDIITVLYERVLNIAPETIECPDRDRFILSKGHGVMALYAVLNDNGSITDKDLESYAKNYSKLAEHPLAGTKYGVEFATGSLGHGLAVAAGMAKSLKLRSCDAKVFTLLGDGECDEGAIWEAAAISANLKLDNLTAIVDRNGMQACGLCNKISSAVKLIDCWRSFGWDAYEVDGHNYDRMEATFKHPEDLHSPRVIFCDTVKGKGVSFMENDLNWHYRPVKGLEQEEALKELENA